MQEQGEYKRFLTFLQVVCIENGFGLVESGRESCQDCTKMARIPGVQLAQIVLVEACKTIASED